MPGAKAEVWLDINTIVERMMTGARLGLEEVGERLAADAKRRAPIRKAFKERPGYRRHFRKLTSAERDLVIRRANAYYTPAGFRARWHALSPSQRAKAAFNYSHAEVRRPNSANSLKNSRAARVLGYERSGRFSGIGGATRNRMGVYEPGPAMAAKMTSRARYEARTGASIHHEVMPSGATRVQVGGKLKASIGATGVVESGRGQRVNVVAAIRYAKFVEFPTIHNAAQPFLRPALFAERPRFRATIAAAIRSSLGG